MTKLEKAEKIIEKTGVTYDEAKEALEACGEDMLDAIVYLENQGKVKGPAQQVYTTKTEDSSKEFQQAAKAYEAAEEEKLGNIFLRLLKWCGQLIKKGCENFFIIKRHGEEIISAPVIVLVLLLLFAFWVIVPILIVGLFFGYSYSFRGEITKAVDLNTAFDKAAEAAESVKKEFHEESKKESRPEK